MKNGAFCLLALCLILAGTGTSPAREGHLTLETRIAAQTAIARIKHAHQIESARPFGEAFPGSLAERTVREYLRKSVALDRFWKRPVTRHMFRREVDRMIRETRMPGRLNELFAALGYDRLLIEECVARPLLVDRLTRNYFAFDQSIHADARSAIEAIRRDLLSGAIEPHADHPGRTVVEFRRAEPARRSDAAEAMMLRRLTSKPGARREIDLQTDEFAARIARLPESAGAIGAIEEERDRLVLPVVLARETDSVQVARYTIAKRPWHEWWREVAAELDDGIATTALGPAVDPDAGRPPAVLPARIDPLPPDFNGSSCGADDSWSPIAGSFLIARWDHSAVWTGDRMIVWGGYDGSWFDDGGLYDPATETWSPTSMVGAPTARSGHTAVWTGSEMLVWGGADTPSTTLASGGRYDPVSDSWSPMAMTGAPAARRDHSAIWTGSEMVVWGGADGSGTTLASGGRYDPVSDAWEPTSMIGAPEARLNHPAIWTGGEMVVWGGGHSYYSHYVGTGGRYDPALDTWSPISMVDAPSARSHHAAVWTGDEMIVWGGETSDPGASVNDGARYNPLTDTWTPTTITGAPNPMWNDVAAVWTGDRMIVWGATYVAWPPGTEGAAYDPVLDAWSTFSTLNAPVPGGRRPVIWTGDAMIIWGGLFYFSLHTGGRYDPAADVWTPIGSSNPTRREYHSTVWTGNLMIVWGGYRGVENGWADTDSGARYDPVTNDWTPTSYVNAPEYRDGHSAVWTGDRMIVWGGGNSVILNTGGQYDPLTDAWQPTSTVNAPAERAVHTAFWTGDRMIVWGGFGNQDADVGGIYDPIGDSWTAMSDVQSPGGRYNHAAVWTGDRMIVWGGNSNTFQTLAIDLGDGGIYDPATDSWAPLTSLDAPAPRREHSGVWTGDALIVWGGQHDGIDFDTGGRYDLSTGTWSPTTTTGAPAARRLHRAVWLGDRMILWGGGSGPTKYVIDAAFDSGARYDPVTDTWTGTSQTGAPFARYNPSAVVVDDQVLIWGGRGVEYSDYYDDGGAYCACAAAARYDDLDGDGFGDPALPVDGCAPPAGAVADASDCDDGDPDSWGTPSEVGDLMFQSEVTLIWATPSAPGSSLPLYDVIRSGDPSDFVSGASCVATDVAANTFDDTTLPALGSAFIYLSRAESGCPVGGGGSLGTDSSGMPRAGRSCP